jgi:hypothetical protein
MPARISEKDINQPMFTNTEKVMSTHWTMSSDIVVF